MAACRKSAQPAENVGRHGSMSWLFLLALVCMVSFFGLLWYARGIAPWETLEFTTRDGSGVSIRDGSGLSP